MHHPRLKISVKTPQRRMNVWKVASDLEKKTENFWNIFEERRFLGASKQSEVVFCTHFMCLKNRNGFLLLKNKWAYTSFTPSQFISKLRQSCIRVLSREDVSFRRNLKDLTRGVIVEASRHSTQLSNPKKEQRAKTVKRFISLHGGGDPFTHREHGLDTHL